MSDRARRLRPRLGFRSRVRRDEQGASLVEFALVLPIFALLLFAMIDFGLVFQSFISLRNGVNAGARVASVSGATDSSCTTASTAMLCTVKDRVGALLAAQSNTVAVEIQWVNRGTGTSITSGSFSGDYTQYDVKVCGWATLKSTTGLTSPFINNKVLSSVSQLRLEQKPSYQAGTYPGSLPAGDSC